MRHLIISDTHENYATLHSILEVAKQSGGYDDIWFLGDAVGHCGEGSHCDAVQCLSLLQETQAVCILGNWEAWLLQPDEHDRGHLEPHEEVLQQLQEELSFHDLLAYVKSWDWLVERDGFTLTHGCPYQRHDDDNYRAKPWETYLRPIDTPIVDRIFSRDMIKTPHLVVGHTHEPGYFHYNGISPRWNPFKITEVEAVIPMDFHGGRYVLNPGSMSYNYGDVPWPTALLLDTKERFFQFLTPGFSGKCR